MSDGDWPAGRTSKGQAGLWKAERAGALKGKLLQMILLVLDRSRALVGPDTWGRSLAQKGQPQKAPDH